MNALLFACAYYAEHETETDWRRDAKRMQELGLDAIRVGEFCWSRMQRSDGTLTLDWLERLVDLFGSYGIRTILCTPSATPPAWVMDRYPELPVVLPDGRRGEFGGRRHCSLFHEGYRELAVGLARGLAERFGQHPHVAGWHLDNEVGSYSTLDCSAPALAAFHRWLAETYGTVAELNRRWGLIFWNQEVERFDQVPAPTEMMTTRSPQAILAYNRFCRSGMAEFLLAQARAIRPLIGASQWVVASCHENVQHELFARQRAEGREWVDYVELNNYPELLPQPGQSAMRLDRQRCLDRPRPFLTLEQQVGNGHTTSGGLDGRVRRFWAWETLARGGRAVGWFHWVRFQSGCEWRLSSIVERDRRPRQAFRELQAVIAEARRVEHILCGSTILADAQIYFEPDSVAARDRASEGRFWMEIQLPDGWHERFPMWEKEVRRAVYQPLTALGLTVDFVQPHDEWDPALPLFLPDMDLVDESHVARLTAFLEQGGTVVAFPGIGERDRDGKQGDRPSPGLLGPLFGISQDDVVPLPAGIGAVYDPAMGRLTGEQDYAVDISGHLSIGGVSVALDLRHAEIPLPEDAEVLARYADGFAAGRPAVTQRRVGPGRAIYLGAVPASPEDAIALYQGLGIGLPSALAACPGVRLRATDGRTYRFHLNGGPSPCDLGSPCHDVITDQPLSTIPPFGVALSPL